MSIPLRTGVFACLLATSSFADPPQMLEEPFLVDRRPWTLAWNDEFPGDALDAQKWTPGLPWPGTDGAHRQHNAEYASYMDDDNIRVVDGVLHLLTQRRDVTAKNGKVFHYTQAMVTTHKTFRQSYGYLEVRVKLPVEAGPGLWPAFWTLADGWPPEMDIAEVWTSSNRSHQGLAYRGENNAVRWDDRNTHTPLPTGWATYGMEWGPGYQVYNLNGIVTHRVHGAHVPDVANYLLLNSGVASANGPTAATIFPNAFMIDYVRVYSRADGATVLNGDFELGELWPWTTYGRSVIVAYGTKDDAAIRNKHVIRVNGPRSGVEQRLFGLTPGATYRLSAQIRVLREGDRVLLGVKNQGAAQVETPATQTEWTTITATFNAGENATTATIFCYAEEESSAFLDDVEIEQIP